VIFTTEDKNGGILLLREKVPPLSSVPSVVKLEE